MAPKRRLGEAGAEVEVVSPARGRGRSPARGRGRGRAAPAPTKRGGHAAHRAPRSHPISDDGPDGEDQHEGEEQDEEDEEEEEWEDERGFAQLDGGFGYGYGGAGQGGVEEDDEVEEVQPGSQRGRKRARGHHQHQAPAPPPPDPLTQAASQLVQMSQVTEEEAKELLREVLAQDPTLAQDIALWVEEAQMRIAISLEVDLEATDLRHAMAESLKQQEQERARQLEEEQREGRVANARRKFPDSAVLRELSRVVCVSLLLASPAQEALHKLLDLEKKCNKWYDSAGTRHFFATLAQDLGEGFAQDLEACARASGLLLHPLPPPQAPLQQQQQQQPGPLQPVQPPQPAAALQAVPPGNGDAQAPPPLLLRCVRPPSACPHCGAAPPAAAAPEDGTGGGGGGGGAAEQPAEGAAGAEAFLPQYPQVAQCFARLEALLTAKEAHIQHEVARMPDAEPPPPPAAEGGAGGDANGGRGSSGGGGAGKQRQGSGPPVACGGLLAVFVPHIFRLPPGVEATEVVECLSDDD